MRAILMMCMFAFSALANAQGAAPGQYSWEEFGKRIKASEKVAPLGPDLFGDQVSLSNGALSFSATDVSLPGSNGLPVAFSRTYSVFNRKDYSSDRALADWDIQVPNLNAVFATEWLTTGATPSARCSSFAGPPPPVPAFHFSASDYWQGINLDIPGVASGELLATLPTTTKPGDGANYYWMTSSQVHVSCLSTIKNGTGEGFLAIAPDGTRYWFDWMAQYAEPMSKRLLPPDPMITLRGHEVIFRKKNVLYATRVEDRFGNRVDYTYTNAWNSPAKLTQITASDGRQLTINYSNGYISSVTDGTRTWGYAYANTTSGRKTLTTVTQPDTHAWNIDFSAFTNGEIKYHEINLGEIWRTCTQLETPLNYLDTPVGLITHPSGAVGTFKVSILEHGRSKVPVNCSGYTSGPGAQNDPNDDVNLYATSYNSFTLTRKTISGPGLATAQWNYDYQANTSVHRYPGTTMVYPLCVLGDVECMETPCPPATCTGGSSKTTVTDPDGDWIRYSHGNTYLNNEGKLLLVEEGETGNPTPLRTITHSYDLSLTNHVYPARYGSSLREYRDGFESEYHRPQTASATHIQAEDFTWSASDFNYFAQPLTVKRESSLGYSKTDAYTYENNTSKWVIGQVKAVTCLAPAECAGMVSAQASYDPATANQLTFSSFGKLLQTMTYNTDGTVATVKDGNNNVTTLSSWYRGIPRTVKFPATPEATSGATQTAAVNSQGWITSVTDENTYTTGYGYDEMGRLASITYPAADTTAWNNTSLTFEKVSNAAYGTEWLQTVITGNARKTTYFDRQWRPLVTREYDTTDVAGTQRFQRFTYDHEGRITFASYPGITDSLTAGTWTFYDALGRTVRVAQDSEFGASQPINVVTDYLPGFLVSTTNPRGEVTISSYKAYDQPSQDWPMIISHPEGQQTTIARDAFGKPTALTRSGGGLSVTRNYKYDDYQRLCFSVEPETGGSVMDYDSVGNVLWSASGQSFTATSTCAAARTAATDKVTRTYDARRRLKTMGFPDGRGNQSWAYTADSLPSQIATNNVSGSDQVINAYTYNKRRLLIGESMTQPGSNAWPLGYDYDGNASLAGVTYPSALYVGYAPNALGQAKQAGSYATGVQYYPNGAIKQFTYGNNIIHTMTQNARQLPVRSTDIGGGTALDLAYTFDKNSNVSGIIDYVDGRQTRNMTYDGLDRLLTTSSVMFGGDNMARYAYDALDNIATLKVGGNRDHTYVYDAKQRLGNVKNTAGGATVVGLSYDVRGNVINKNGQAYDFDFGNRLRAATNAESYRYDGYGRRVRASLSASSHILSMYGQDGVLRRQEDWRTGKLTDYIYLGGSQVARVSNAPTLSAPTVTAPAYNTAGSYTVQWSSVASANRHELEEQLNAGAWLAVYSGTALSKAVSGKTSGSYGYRARGCLATICGAWSTVVTVAVQLPPVLAPSLSVPATALNGNFSVTWGTVSGATSYTLEQSANGGAWTTSYTGSALTKAFANIGAGSFAYRVKACNPAGCGDLSGVGTVQALYPPGGALTPTVAAQSTTGSYTVSWTAVGTATSYRLEESINSGAWAQIQDAAAISRAITGKAAGSYGYRVRACNAAGCGGYSGIATTLVTLIPTAAPTLTAPATGDAGPYLVSWTSVSTATSYRLEQNTGGAGWVQIQDATATSRTISGMGPGSHAYRSRGCNVAGCGPYSNTGTVVVSPPPPATPGGFTAKYTLLDGPTSTRYVTRWLASTGATSYQVDGYMSYDGPNLTANRTYAGGHVPSRTFRVRACNANGCSAWAADIPATQVGGP